MRYRWVAAVVTGLAAWVLLAVPASGQDVTTLLTQFLSGLRSGFVSYPLVAADPSTTTEGSFYYNSGSHGFKFYNGSAWTSVGASFPLAAPDGACSAPDYAFANATTTGITHASGDGTLWRLCANGATVGAIDGNGIAGSNGSSSGYVLTGTGLKANAAIAFMATPTISSGFGTSPSILSSNGSATFRINVGTGGAATSGVVGLATASTGWNCLAIDATTNVVTRQTASTTATVTLTAAAAWTASDTLIVQCLAY